MKTVDDPDRIQNHSKVGSQRIENEEVLRPLKGLIPTVDERIKYIEIRLR